MKEKKENRIKIKEKKDTEDSISISICKVVPVFVILSYLLFIITTSSPSIFNT
jgi:hypothetical protein